MFAIKDGDIFSRDIIANSLEELRKVYGELGYINFTSVPETRFDEMEKTVTLDIKFDEGKRFVVSAVKVIGLDGPSSQAFLDQFPLKRGDLYNQNLLELALVRSTSLPINVPIAHYTQKINEREGTAALTFDFRDCSAD